jgi:hypothetical protein
VAAPFHKSNKGFCTFRSLARRGASVLVAAAVLGGGLALGVGTASAQEAPVGVIGSVEDLAFGAVILAGVNAGSIDENDIFLGCTGTQLACPDPWPTHEEILAAWLQGIDPGVAFPTGENPAPRPELSLS